MNEAHENVIDHLRARCADGPISYRDYIELALYTDGCGYYTRAAERVGRSPERDFYTAESLGKVFAQLVSTAAEDLLGTELTAQSSFVEIAAEPGRSLLDNLESSPFLSSKVIRQGEPIAVDGPVVLFANEWLDCAAVSPPDFQGRRLARAWRQHR